MLLELLGLGDGLAEVGGVVDGAADVEGDDEADLLVVGGVVTAPGGSPASTVGTCGTFVDTVWMPRVASSVARTPLLDEADEEFAPAPDPVADDGIDPSALSISELGVGPASADVP